MFRICVLRQWLESRQCPRTCKEAGPVRMTSSEKLTELERKMDQMMLHSTISFGFVFAVVQRGRPPSGQATERWKRGLGGVWGGVLGLGGWAVVLRP